MYTLTLTTRKRGTGKAMLAINLSVAAEAAGGPGPGRRGDHRADFAVINTAPHSECAPPVEGQGARSPRTGSARAARSSMP